MKKLTHSIKYALQGIAHLFITQRNARFHLVAASMALALGFWLKISVIEWAFITLCISAVIGAEAFNTAIETMCDTLHHEIHPKIKIVKDLSAAAVLIISIGALVIGSLIFLPKLLDLFL
ncbi:MAG: diacylglycerol kinase family protein [Bacteroidia bacterium]